MTLYASSPSTSTLLSFTQVGAVPQGSFAVGLVGGGRLTGTFAIQ